MLDLTVINRNLYEIRLLDGTELHLKRPSQAMVQFLLNAKELQGHADEEATLDMFSNLFTRVLNANTDGVSFNQEDLAEDYDFQTIAFVIQDYFDYWEKEVVDNVVFRQSQ